MVGDPHPAPLIPSCRPVFIMQLSKADIAYTLTFASWFWTSLVACVAVFSSDMGQYAKVSFITSFTGALFGSVLCATLPLSGADDFGEFFRSTWVAILLLLSTLSKINGIEKTVAMSHHFHFDDVNQAHMVIQAFTWTCVSVGIEFALLVVYVGRTCGDPAARQEVVQFFTCCFRSPFQPTEEIPMSRQGAPSHRTSPYTNFGNDRVNGRPEALHTNPRAYFPHHG
ncbi:hypothetical protein DENSPDRAFT_840746 [Dentipellis sp. KUC8613]|nr:hypothetical protein DENSPDRAFT_840746 [Dentipellis sp. KUC8613]